MVSGRRFRAPTATPFSTSRTLNDRAVRAHRGGRSTRLPEGVAGVQQLHALIADRTGGEPDQVLVAIETDRGPWVIALVTAGYRVFAVNTRQAGRFRERFALSGAKSDAADAH